MKRKANSLHIFGSEETYGMEKIIKSKIEAFKLNEHRLITRGELVQSLSRLVQDSLEILIGLDHIEVEDGRKLRVANKDVVVL